MLVAVGVAQSRGGGRLVSSVADVSKVVDAFLGTHGYDEAFVVRDADTDIRLLLAAVCKTLTGEDRLLVYFYCHAL